MCESHICPHAPPADAFKCIYSVDGVCALLFTSFEKCKKDKGFRFAPFLPDHKIWEEGLFNKLYKVEGFKNE